MRAREAVITLYMHIYFIIHIYYNISYNVLTGLVAEVHLVEVRDREVVVIYIIEHIAMMIMGDQTMRCDDCTA